MNREREIGGQTENPITRCPLPENLKVLNLAL